MPRKKFPHLKLVDPATLPDLVIHLENPTSLLGRWPD